VLFPTPETIILEMTSPLSYKAVLKEPALKEDATSGQVGQLPTYNAYSADGDVSAELVFVNYGIPEDYEVLDRMGIDVNPGDPLTPGIGATKDAKRLDRLRAPILLKIPVLPISYHDAAPLLEALVGPVVPEDWHDGLPFAIHAGAGKTKVHLKVTFNWNIVPCYDVIARIKGSKYPDEWIIRGNHHDAWVNGAGDPISGQAAMLEEAKSLGSLLNTGWKPDRTIVYCAWDGEEPGLLGSTEWVEDHEKELKDMAVVYINSDSNGRGFLFAQGSNSLEPLMDEIAKQVADPQTGVCIFERRKDHKVIIAKGTEAKKRIWNEKDLKLYALGSGSDYSSFIQHAGIPSLNLGFDGEDESGDYHSIYDSYDLYIKFKDPGFQYGVTLAETAGHAVLRMSDADGLPFDFTHLSKAVTGYSNELMALLKTNRETTDLENTIISSGAYAVGEDPLKRHVIPLPKTEVPYLDFSPLLNALQLLGKSVGSLSIVFQNNIITNKMNEVFNQSLLRAEQQLLNETGLPRRDWYKNILYAPGFYTGYGVKTLPGIREAIEQRNWNEAQEQIVIDAKIIMKLASYFKEMYSHVN
jgi:N-acetylated-alpha-linked acidic dipeptidase